MESPQKPNAMATPATSAAKSAKNKRKNEAMKAKKKLTAEKKKEMEENQLMEKLAEENRAAELKKPKEKVVAGKKSAGPTRFEVDSVLNAIEQGGFPFEIKDTETAKGLGVFATEDIEAGQVILKERPIFVGESIAITFEAMFAILGDVRKTQLTYLAELCLCGVGTDCIETRLSKILNANVFSTATDTYLYRVASRFNHSCDPNAAKLFNKDGIIQIKADKDIKAGEEITIMLANVWGKATDRMKLLKRGLNGLCLCDACHHFKITEKPVDYVHNRVVTAVEPGLILNFLTAVERANATKAGEWADRVRNQLEVHTVKLQAKVLNAAIVSMQCGGMVMKTEEDILEESTIEWLADLMQKNEVGLNEESLKALAADRRNHWALHLANCRVEVLHKAREFVAKIAKGKDKETA